MKTLPFFVLKLLALHFTKSVLVFCFVSSFFIVSPLHAAEPRVFQVLPGQGHIMVLLHRTNSLGHDHVIVNQSITGSVEYDAQNIEHSRFRLMFPVAKFLVDDPKWREQAGGVFAEPFAEGDRPDVRDNMLGADILDAKKFPSIEAFSESVAGTFPNLNVAVVFLIHGAKKVVTVPVKVKTRGEKFYAKGEFSIKQTEFDITPFSILFGAIGIKDEMDIRFEIVGTAVN